MGKRALIKNIVLTVLLLALVVYTIILIIDSISLIEFGIKEIEWANAHPDEGAYDLYVSGARGTIKANIFKLIYYSAVIFTCGLFGIKQWKNDFVKIQYSYEDYQKEKEQRKIEKNKEKLKKLKEETKKLEENL